MKWRELILGFGLCLSVVFWLWVFAPAQTPPPACETQVSEQYRQLASDQIVSTPAATWNEQLTALVGELRLVRTQLELKQGQLAQSERNLAVLVEQRRQLTQTQQRLQAELEQAKNGKPPQESPPAKPSIDK